MIYTFVNKETEYLLWIKNNKNGFIVNFDEPLVTPEYPKVHRATHKLLSSNARTNYTTGRYRKSLFNRLKKNSKKWAVEICGKTLTRCLTCM